MNIRRPVVVVTWALVLLILLVVTAWAGIQHGWWAIFPALLAFGWVSPVIELAQTRDGTHRRT